MKSSAVKLGAVYSNVAGDRVRVLRAMLHAVRGKGWWVCERVTPTMQGAVGSQTVEHSRALVAVSGLLCTACDGTGHVLPTVEKPRGDDANLCRRCDGRGRTT